MEKQRTAGGVSLERSSGNVYADLVYADSGGILVKAQLACKIA